MIRALRRFFAGDPTPNPRDPSDDWWYTDTPAIAAPAGVSVTPASALKVTAVRTCLQILADPLGSLPIRIFERLADGGKRPADQHPLADLLRKQANPRHSAFEFRSLMQWHLGCWNNAYAEILPGPRGAIDNLIPLHPDRVMPFWGEGDRVWYRVTDRRGRQRTLSDSEVWHLRGTPMDADGLCGLARLIDGSDVIGQALALQNYAARFFANDGQSGGVLEHPGQFKDPASRERWLESWRKARTGRAAHRDALLEFGIKYNRGTQLNNQHAQFLETRKELAIEIGRLWQIPPHKLGILDRATHSNIEQQSLEFVTQTLLPWLVLWEQAINRDLILNDRYFAEFNVAGLLRGDLKSRYEAFAQGRQWGWLSINDIRRLENMDPVDDGDDYLQPLNMQPVGAPAPPPPAALIQPANPYTAVRRPTHA